MTTIEESVTIPAPVHAVFKYASDWRTWADWFEGVWDFRLASEISRGDGARYAYRARVMGIPAPVETEVRDFVEDRGWTGVATGRLHHRTHWLFEAQGESTRFTYGLEYELPLPVLGAALDALVMRPEWRRIIRKSLANLQAYFSDAAPEANS